MATKFYTKYDKQSRTLYYNDSQIDETWKEAQNVNNDLYSVNDWKNVLPYKPGLKIKFDNDTLYYGNGLTKLDASGFVLAKYGVKIIDGQYSRNPEVLDYILPQGYETAYLGGFLNGQPFHKLTPNKLHFNYGTEFKCDKPIYLEDSKYLKAVDIVVDDTQSLLTLSDCETLTITSDHDLTINCPKLKKLTVKGNIQNLIINNCANLLQLNCANCKLLSKIDLPKYCALSDLNVQGTALTSFTGILYTTSLNESFKSCEVLKTVNLVALRGITNWTRTFYYCKQLTTINMNNPLISGVGTYTFAGCTNLKGKNGTVYDPQKTDYTMAKNDNSTPGYFNFNNEAGFKMNAYPLNDNRFSIIYDPYPTKNTTIKFNEIEHGYTLDFWLLWNGTQWEKVSEKKEYTFNVNSDVYAIAIPKLKEIPETVKVSLSVSPLKAGTVAGAGTYIVGDNIKVTAKANKGFRFIQWDELIDGQWVKISEQSSFIIVGIGRNRTLKAIFEEVTDPYNPSEPGGGGGNYDDTSDPIDKDDVSNLINAGFGRVATIYTPTKEQFDDFFNYLYGSNFENVIADLATRLNTLGGKPLDYVLNCYILPVDITPKDPADIKTKPFNLGWYDIKTLDMNYSEHRFMDYGCGEIEIKPYWGNALDYKSTIQIYLPYIGYKSLDCAEVMGHKVGVKYTIDFMTGDCVAKVLIDRSIHYQFNGNLAYKLPLSSSNFTDLLEASLSIGTNMAIGAATGTITGGASLATSVAQGATQMMNVGGNVSRAGNLPSNTGVLSVQTPYIIINRPRLSVPENYAHYHGFPSNITCQLKTLQGYTEVSDIHLENITATLTELQEIETLLKQGVII